MHAFFVESIPETGMTAELEKSEHHHLFKTLRAVPGDEVKLLDGRGVSALAQVGAERTLRVVSREVAPEPGLKIRLYCAAPRKNILDGMLKQLAEVGVWRIEVIRCERSVALPDFSERWEALLREGCKQSNNPFLPPIGLGGTLDEALSALKGEGVPVYYGAVTPPGNRPAVPADGEIALLIGPEGGFSPSELERIGGSGGIGVSFGPYILRMETAAVCGVALLRGMA